MYLYTGIVVLLRFKQCSVEWSSLANQEPIPSLSGWAWSWAGHAHCGCSKLQLKCCTCSQKALPYPYLEDYHNITNNVLGIISLISRLHFT